MSSCDEPERHRSEAVFEIHDEGHGVLRLVGELDAATAPQLLRRIGEAPVVTEVDLSELTFIDSTGLMTLVVGAEACNLDAFTLRDPSRHVRRLLELVGVTDRFRIQPGTPP